MTGSIFAEWLAAFAFTRKVGGPASRLEIVTATAKEHTRIVALASEASVVRSVAKPDAGLVGRSTHGVKITTAVVKIAARVIALA